MPSQYRHVVHVNGGNFKLKPTIARVLKHLRKTLLVNWFARPIESEPHRGPATNYGALRTPSVIVNRQDKPEIILDSDPDNILQRAKRDRM